MRKDRTALFQKIHLLAKEIGYLQRGLFPTIPEQEKIERYWVKFFGFQDLTYMTIEDLRNFIELLQAKIRAEKRIKCFPEFHDYLGAGAHKEGESLYD